MSSTRFSGSVTALYRAHHSHLILVQRLCREVLIWKRLSHPNILPLVGVSVAKNPRHFRIISEWMPNGNVMEYTRSNPRANRLRLVSSVVRFLEVLYSDNRNPQLSEVAFGVTYLHELGIVHGDLKGVRHYTLHGLCIADESHRRTSSSTTWGPFASGISV